MKARQVGAALLALLTACSSTTHGVSQASAPYGPEPAAAHYELKLLTPHTTESEPVEVDEEDFEEALVKLLRSVRPSTMPRESARRLFESEQEGEFLAQVEDGHIVRMIPLAAGHASSSRVDAELTRGYLQWCAHTRGDGDCLGLLSDGPMLHGDDRYALAMAMALGSVLDETQHTLKEMVDPRAVLATVLWAVTVYMMLWVLPEPVSKGVAAALTTVLLAWLGVDTVWSLLGGWMRLVEEADRATTFEHLRAAGTKYSRVLGENTARVLVMLVTAALGGTAAKLAERMPRLPGFSQAAVQAEAQGGVRLATVAEVETVSASAEGSFSILTRSRKGASGAAPSGPRPAITTVIQHQGGNRQVVLNGQRWHVPANKSVKEIPAVDPVGDQLQAAATRAAQQWNPNQLSFKERNAIRRATAQGEHWLAQLLERQARGRFVEKQLRDEFLDLRWNRSGVDAIDPATGRQYEILSGTDSNLALHGQRLAETLFRMITF